MFESRFARVGLLAAGAGICVLAASVFQWQQTTPSRGLIYAVNEYEWLRSDSSALPAISTDERWFFPASCVRPIYQSKVDNFKAKLAEHNSTKPPVTVYPAESNRGSRVRSNSAIPDYKSFASDLERFQLVETINQEAIKRVAERFGDFSFEDSVSIPFALVKNDLKIDPTYLATRLRLESLIRQWESSEKGLEDKRALRNEVVRESQSYFGQTIEKKIEAAAQRTLGLSAFSGDETKSVISRCLDATGYKKVVSSTEYRTDIAKWPAEYPVPFWAGIALLLIGIAFPIAASWVVAGQR